jgi:hypothetical protein
MVYAVIDADPLRYRRTESRIRSVVGPAVWSINLRGHVLAMLVFTAHLSIQLLKRLLRRTEQT